MIYITLFIAIIYSNPHLGQNDFKQFLSGFEKVDIPYCLDYSDRDAAWLNPEQFDTVIDSEEPYRDSLKIISANYLKAFIFQDQDSVPEINIWNLDTLYYREIESVLDSTTSEFYYGKIIRRGKFVVITYEQRDYGNSYRYICTFNKNGQLISKLLCAFYAHSGSSLMEDGSRIPWYAEKHFCIDEGFIITTTTPMVGYSPAKYIIDKFGEIKKN